jgi:hypothetical protein
VEEKFSGLLEKYSAKLETKFKLISPELLAALSGDLLEDQLLLNRMLTIL